MKKKQFLYTSLAAVVLTAFSAASVAADELALTSPAKPLETTEAENPREALHHDKATLEAQLDELAKERQLLDKDEDIVAYHNLTKEETGLLSESAKLKKNLNLDPVTGRQADLDKTTAERQSTQESIEALTAQQNDPELSSLAQKQGELVQEREQKTAEKERQLTELRALNLDINQTKNTLNTQKNRLTSEQDKLARTQQQLDKVERDLRTLQEAPLSQLIGEASTPEPEGRIRFQRDANNQKPQDSNGNVLTIEDLANGELMEAVNYSGTKTETITLTNPENAYVPNNDNLSRWAVHYINELRRLNGLEPSLQVTEEAKNKASEWAKFLATTTRFEHRNPYIYEENLMFYEELGDVRSDQELAYQLIQEWFADYIGITFNRHLGYYGHRSTLFSNVPDFALVVEKGNDGYYFVLNSSQVEYNRINRFNLVTTPAPSGGVDTKLQMAGRDMVFLPKTTFVYRTAGKTPEEMANETRTLTSQKEGLEKAIQETIPQNIDQLSATVTALNDHLVNLEQQALELSEHIDQLEQDLRTIDNDLATVTRQLANRGAAAANLTALQERLALFDQLLPKLERLLAIETTISDNKLAAKYDDYLEDIKEFDKRRLALNNELTRLNSLLNPPIVKPEEGNTVGDTGGNTIDNHLPLHNQETPPSLTDQNQGPKRGKKPALSHSDNVTDLSVKPNQQGSAGNHHGLGNDASGQPSESNGTTQTGVASGLGTTKEEAAPQATSLANRRHLGAAANEGSVNNSPVNDKQGRLVTGQQESTHALSAQPAAPKAAQTAPVTKQTLPQTNDQPEQLLIGAGAILAALGIAARRRQED